MAPNAPLTQFQASVGFGELGISTPAASSSASSNHAAGVWALEGAADQVNALKAGGPTATAAVVAYSDRQAVWAESKIGPAVSGTSQTAEGVYGHSSSGIAVVGESATSNGVYGVSHASGAAAVAGRNLSTDAFRLAGYFDGDVQLTGYLEGHGCHFASDINATNINVGGIVKVAKDGDIQLASADCAEQFDLAPDATGEPGMVMVMDESEKLVPCSSPYDTRVAGVISGAEEYRPGIILDQRETGCARKPIALIGKVYCKVDATYGAIKVGDLLTSSPTPGHAMKASDALKAFGTTLGKAMRQFPEGQGMIPVLVALS